MQEQGDCSPLTLYLAPFSNEFSGLGPPPPPMDPALGPHESHRKDENHDKEVDP